MNTRDDSYNNPVYVHETHYGFWWLVGTLLAVLVRVVVWAVVLVAVVLVNVFLLLFRRKHRHAAQHRWTPRNPRLFYSDRR